MATVENPSSHTYSRKEANNPFWRVLASLKELLPEGDDLTQVQELISNSADLIQHCGEIMTYTQGTLFN